MSNEGVSVWEAKRKIARMKRLSKDIVNDLLLETLQNVISNLILPTEGTRYAEISWETSNSVNRGASGEISRPDIGEDPVHATLTAATITKGDISQNKKV